MNTVIAAIGMACLAMAGIVLLLGLGVIAAWEIRAINRLRERTPLPPAGPFQALNGQVDRTREWDHR
jgi:hypothetical protein